MSTALLRREVTLLKARTTTARKLRIPDDRVESARRSGSRPTNGSGVSLVRRPRAC